MNFPLSCYRSNQSKLILFLGFIAILISVFKYYSFKLILRSINYLLFTCIPKVIVLVFALVV